MVSKVLKVFYGEDYLPYKDSERTIHFPVGGNTFAGTQNTFRICFYPRDLVGSNDLVEQTSWVLVSKLPNGKLGYQLLSTIQTDSDLGEKYLVFDLSSYYSQYKGVVKLAIRGYQGEISFVEDEETHVYSVVGTPIIGVTGTIDIAINYSPMVYGEQLLPSELDQLVAKFSDYVSLAQWQDNWLNRIIVIGADLDDYSDYEEGQLFYRSDLHKVMILDNGSLEQFDFGYIQHGTLTTTDTLADLRDNYGLDKYFLLENSSASYLVKLTSGLPGRLNYTFIDIGGGRVWSSMIQQSTTIQQVLSSTPQEYATQSYVVSNYYNKSEVDNLLTQIEQREFQKVNTTTYPTLNDFLASEGEEGYIYLYPIDTSDETKGFYQYIWEDNEWVSLGTTQIDLSGYVEKTSSANKVYGTNELGAQTTYTVDDFYEGNIARRDSDGSITVPLTPSANGEATSKKYVDDLTTLKTLNGTDLHGTGNIAYDDELDDISTNAVQNKVLNAELTATKDELAQLKSIVYETTIEEDSFTEEHLQESALPLSVNSKSIVFSAGMDNTDIKGRSFVYNQLVQNGNFESSDNWSLINDSYVSISISNNKATITSLISGGNSTYYGLIQNTDKIVNGHKYLITAKVKSSVQASVYAYFSAIGNNVNLGNSTTSEKTLFGLITATSSSTSIRISCVVSTNVGDYYEISNIQIFDLTDSGIDSATTADEAIALLLQNGINPYEYNEYNAGEIIDSKPIALVSHGFNVWDEEWELGYFGTSTGTEIDSTTQIRAKNYIKVIPSKTYAFTVLSTGGLWCMFFDKNYNIIDPGSPTYGGVSNYARNVSNRTDVFIPNNCVYVRFYMTTSYGATYLNDICINISNATLNGTYKPYKAPITYPISLPVLRSAGSVQDNTSKVNVGTYTFTGNEYVADNGTYGTYSDLPALIGMKTQNTNILIIGFQTLSSGVATTPMSCSIGSALNINVDNVGANVKSYMAGKTIYFEKATPTDQPSITLPENIEIEKGGSIEATYDSTATTPSDFDFQVATYKPMEE